MVKVVVVDSTGAVAAGPAIPIEVLASAAGQPVEGKITRVVQVTDADLAANRYKVAGGRPIPVVVGTADVDSAGGPAIPVYVAVGTLPGGGSPTVGGVTPQLLGTSFTGDLSPDGITWAAQRGAFEVDAFGKYIAYIQRYNTNNRLCYFLYSNDQGTTWNDNTGVVGGEGFLTRGSIVYDAARDCLHGLIVTTNPSDGGIIYRRYSIARDGSNNITSIARVGGVSVVLDDAGANNSNGIEFPTILMPDANTLVAAWTVRTTSPGGEIRACKCDITSNADAGGTASNWVHLGVNSTTTIGSAPSVGSYTIPFTQAAGNALTYFSLKVLASGSLQWVYHSGPTPGAWNTRRSVKNASVTWNSLSSPVSITNVARAGSDTGYTLKNQLVSQLTEDAAGNVYIGLATWKSDAAGDTWGAYAISPAGVVSSSDIYSAGGVHSYAPTGDCAWDSGSSQLMVTYEKTTTQFAYLQLLTAALGVNQAETAVNTAVVTDIPVIWKVRQDGHVLIGWREAGSPPQPGYSARMPWSA